MKLWGSVRKTSMKILHSPFTAFMPPLANPGMKVISF